MLPWIIPLAVLILLESLADIFAKEWPLGNRSFAYAVLALLAYLLANSAWLIALRSGSGLAKGAIIFSVSSAILATFIGLVLYKEQLSAMQIAGVLIGIISLVLIVWE